MLELIWGAKTSALFDIWSLEHIIAGVSVGAAVIKTNVRAIKQIEELEHQAVKLLHFDISFVLMLAFAWETLEHYLELGLAGEVVAYWFQGTEFWANRMITDPLMMVVGYMIAKKHPQMVIPARIFSILWLATHVFILPHSMTLQELLEKSF